MADTKLCYIFCVFIVSLFVSISASAVCKLCYITYVLIFVYRILTGIRIICNVIRRPAAVMQEWMAQSKRRSQRNQVATLHCYSHLVGWCTLCALVIKFHSIYIYIYMYTSRNARLWRASGWYIRRSCREDLPLAHDRLATELPAPCFI